MKRSLETEDAQDSKRLKPDTVQCSFCRKTFKRRGLSRHLKYCQDKPERPPTAPKDFKFCLLNEQIFDHILGFLGNQTLVKLQAITGDSYPNSRRELAKLCCSCEDDNLAMTGLCAHCEKQKYPHIEQCVNASQARELYGIRTFVGIPRVNGGRRLTTWDDRKLFSRVDLEKHMQKRFGSKIKWLRFIAAKDKKDGGLRKRVAESIQRKAEYEAVLLALPAKCAAYVHSSYEYYYDGAALKKRGERYSTMTTALEARGLQLRDDSKLCREYIMHGYGDVDKIVDTMEEMGFLFGKTSYASRYSAKTSQIHKPCPPWQGWAHRWTFDSDDSDMYSDCDSYCSSDEDSYYEKLQQARENTKTEVCIEYLQNSKGLTLPRKWEACRERFDYIVSVGASPTLYMQYIYTGAGKHPKPETSRTSKSGKGKLAASK